MTALAAGLIAMGLGCLYFALLGKFANANEYPPEGREGLVAESSVARRRTEFAPLAASTYGNLYRRMQRPLIVIGASFLVLGLGILLISLLS
jgi:hypothetical protein